MSRSKATTEETLPEAEDKLPEFPVGMAVYIMTATESMRRYLDGDNVTFGARVISCDGTTVCALMDNGKAVRFFSVLQVFTEARPSEEEVRGRVEQYQEQN